MSQANIKSGILNEVGLCLMSLGRLATAVPFYERATLQQLEPEDWHEKRGRPSEPTDNT